MKKILTLLFALAVPPLHAQTVVAPTDLPLAANASGMSIIILKSGTLQRLTLPLLEDGMSSVNGLTFTASTGTLTIGNSSTLVYGTSGTLTLAGTGTLNVGSGGTLGSNAFTSTTYVTPTGTQTLTNKTVNGVALTAAGTGTLFLNDAGGYSAPAGGGGGGSAPFTLAPGDVFGQDSSSHVLFGVDGNGYPFLRSTNEYSETSTFGFNGSGNPSIGGSLAVGANLVVGGTLNSDGGNFYSGGSGDLHALLLESGGSAYGFNAIVAGNVVTTGSITATSFSGRAILTGTSTAPTASSATSTTQIATTAFVHALQPVVLTGTLTTGTAVIASAAIQSTSVIIPTHKATSAGNAGALFLKSLTTGTVEIDSTNPADNDTFAITIQ